MSITGEPSGEQASSGSSAACRVVLVDDHTMVREALSHILGESGWIEVVGEASDPAGAIKAVRDTAPDVLVLDYNIPDGGALPVIERLVAASWCNTKILVLTIHNSFHYAVRVLEAGADGFAVKADAFQELAKAIDEVWKSGLYLAPALSREVLNHLRQPRKERVGLDALSPREFELLRELGAGTGLKEAARHQNISVSTASTYRSRIMEKLKLSSTAELIHFAIERGLTV